MPYMVLDGGQTLIRFVLHLLLLASGSGVTVLQGAKLHRKSGFPYGNPHLKLGFCSAFRISKNVLQILSQMDITINQLLFCAQIMKGQM